jgi:trk system potassium uptake protein TrkA
MRILVIGAGRVGTSVVAALHAQHDVTVVDLDADHLSSVGNRYDVMTVAGNGTSRSAMQSASIEQADLVIAATDRDEINIVAALQARALTKARIVVRTSSAEYLSAWRAGELPVDVMISAENEIAQAVARSIGMPGALQTDLFAEGRAEMVEFEVHADAAENIVGHRIADLHIPDESVIASLIRADTVTIPGGADVVQEGDRIVLIASPAASREWARRLARRDLDEIRDVVVVGGGTTGRTIARTLCAQGLRVRLVDSNRAVARLCAEELASAPTPPTAASCSARTSGAATRSSAARSATSATC